GGVGGLFFVDVAVGFHDRLPQQGRDRIRRPRRSGQAGGVHRAVLQDLDDLAFEDLHRHAAGAFAAQVAAHAVSDRVQRDVVVAQKTVLVVVALAADVGRAPSDDAHLREDYLTPAGGGAEAGGAAGGGAAGAAGAGFGVAPGAAAG